MLATLSSTQAILLSTVATLSSTQAILLSTPATLSSTPANLLSTAITVFPTPLTLSSTLCVAVKFCATSIRASSAVNLSSFFSASDTSLLPMSLFIYFSDLHSVNCHMLVYPLLTRSALLNLFRRHPENRENLDGYLNHHIHHFRSQLYFCIDVETSKEHFNSLKDVQNGVLACPNVLNCLRNVS